MKTLTQTMWSARSGVTQIGHLYGIDGIVWKSPNSRGCAPNSGLIARDQIARMKQAAPEGHKVEHTLNVGRPVQMSIMAHGNARRPDARAPGKSCSSPPQRMT
jgi:hypothetical protein